MEEPVLSVINQKTQEKITCNRDSRHKHIQIYFLPNREIIIDGSEDYVYSYWLSKTKLYDKALNSDIFGLVTNGVYDYLAHVTNVVDKLGVSYWKLSKCFSIRLEKDKGDANILWKTPFGKNYMLDERENIGKKIADDLVTYYEELQARCRDMEASPNTISILHRMEVEASLATGDAVQRYQKVNHHMEKLWEWSFIKASESEKLREAYVSAYEVLSGLYNDYMSVVR